MSLDLSLGLTLGGLTSAIRRSFLTLGGVNESGSFAPVTLKGDFKIKFKAVNSGAAGYKMILNKTLAGATTNMIAFNGPNLFLRIGNVTDNSFGAVPLNKLLDITIARAGSVVTAVVDGAAQGGSFKLPGDLVFDSTFYHNNANYFDSVVSDLEIIDLDQPATRDVLTFGGVNEYGAMPSITLAGDFDYIYEGSFSATTQQISGHSSGVNQRLYVGTSSGGFAFFGVGSQSAVSGVRVDDGELHTLKIELRSATAQCFVDGVLATTISSVVYNTRVFSDFNVGKAFADNIYGQILDVKLHDLTTPSNSRRYRMDVESNTTIVDDYGSANSLTLNNIISSDWETMTRDTATGEWVGQNLIADPTFSSWTNPTVPDGWTKGGAHHSGNGVAQIPGGGLSYSGPTSYAEVWWAGSLSAGVTYRTTIIDLVYTSGRAIFGTGANYSGWQYPVSGTTTYNWKAEGTKVVFGGAAGYLPTYFTLGGISVQRVLADPTYVQPANILWRMDQGRFGVGAYETNVRADLGANLVTNGTFDTDTSGWTDASDATISVDTQRLKVAVTPATTHGIAYQTITTVAGQSYALGVQYDIGTATNIQIWVGTSGAGSAELYNSGNIQTATGTKNIIFTATTTTTTLSLDVVEGAAYAFFDNISVREAPQAMSLSNIVATDWEKLTQIKTGWLGNELVVNGGFDTDTGWNKGVNVSIGSGVITGASTPTGLFCNRPSAQTLIGGARYRYNLDVTSITSGSLTILLGGSQAGIFPSAVNTYSTIITTTAVNQNIQLNAGGSGVSGSVDNISVKRILETV